MQCKKHGYYACPHCDPYGKGVDIKDVDNAVHFRVYTERYNWNSITRRNEIYTSHITY